MEENKVVDRSYFWGSEITGNLGLSR